MGIQVEFNPDLALRNISEFKSGKRKIEECIPINLKKGDANVAGEKTNYHVIIDATVKEGEIIDAHVLHDGNTYNFRLVDNPKIFTNGEFSFQEMLGSFQFLR